MSKKAIDAVQQLEIIEAILHAIQRSELDCGRWCEDAQKELAFEIGDAVNQFVTDPDTSPAGSAGIED